MDTRWLLLLTGSLLCLAPVARAYPTGPPLAVCNDPYPHHRQMASSAPSPYKLTLNQTEYRPGDVLQVNVSGSQLMKGVMLSAHSTTGAWEVLYGEFVQFPDVMKAYAYYSSYNNCVTHSEAFGDGVSELTLLWRAPDPSAGDLIFSATMVQDFNNFWVNNSALVTAAEPAASGAVKAALMSQPAGAFRKELDVDECGVSSGCVVYPYGCTGRTCHLSASYMMVDNGGAIRFRLTNRHAPRGNSYVGLGISDDIWMEKDETFICIDIGASLNLAQGFNPGWYNIKSRVSTPVRDVVIASVDGTISCEFTRDASGIVAYYYGNDLVNKSLDYRTSVLSAEHHLYLAWGAPYDGAAETIVKHSELPIVSQHKVAFGLKEKGVFYRLHDSVKVHATFMVLSWLGAAAIAMMIARHFKDGFVSAADKLGGLKAWFPVHRGLAFTAAVLTAAGFILIFVHFKRLSTGQLLHAGFGIAVMSLTVIQVLMGLLRPHPDAGKRRTVFNWMHRLNGLLTYSAAAATVLIAARISYTHEALKTVGFGLLVALLALHLVFMLLMEVLGNCFKPIDEGKEDVYVNESRSSGLAVREPSPSVSECRQHRKYTVKFCVFGVYVCLLLVLISCFLVLLWIV